MAKSKKHPNVLLDTSIFYERLKLNPPKFSSKLDRIVTGNKYGVYYSIIELNLGLIKYWVDFYNLVSEIRDVPSSIAEATNWHGRRSTYVGILHSLNARMNQVVSCDDVDRYLDYLEATIANSTTLLEDTVKGFIGEFSKHPLSKLLYLTRDDHANFIVKCEEHKIVPISSYLVKQKKALEELEAYIDDELTRHNTQRNRGLKVLVSDAIADPLDCDKKITKNRKYGDILIALDAPKSQILVSKDTAFEVLCNGLGKQYLNFS